MGESSLTCLTMTTPMSDTSTQFIFTEENFRNPKLPSGLSIVDVPLVLATEQSLQGYGAIVDDPDDFTVEKGTFEIVPWPTQGWRELDPGTGDEAGTTEGNFELEWRVIIITGRTSQCRLLTTLTWEV